MRRDQVILFYPSGVLVEASSRELEFARISGKRILLRDKRLDSAPVVWSLCGIPYPLAAPREMLHVRAPFGRFLSCEQEPARSPRYAGARST